ncbi:MAG: isoaspartyl peptidase/L-asparaginase [Pyrobaculum sp.]
MALDKGGNVAAAVSTGGIWLKWPGRIGDGPAPGAGFWAENGVGAFCATGVGEVILMTLLSYRARNELLKTGNLERAL